LLFWAEQLKHNMPSEFNIAPPVALTEEDRKQYSRMPVWMARQEYKAYQNWFRWKDLFKPLKWKSNSGDVLVAVRPVPSPVQSQVHRPRRMLDNPLVNRHMHSEQTQQATIRRHRYISNPMHWEGDFSDFRDGQVKTQIDDLTRQIAFADEFFIRDQVIAQSKRLYVVGKGLVENIPSGEATDTDPIKTAAFWQNQIANVGNESLGTLDFKTICLIRDLCENDLNIPHWDGSGAKPADNEVLKGRYLLIGAGELYSRLTYDASVTSHRPLAMDLLHSRWKGVISDNIVFQAERYPVRYTTAGVQPPPEIEVIDPAKDYGTSNNTDIVAHPDYVAADIGLAILLGYAPLKTLEVGPPPSEFGGKSISMDAFAKLNWNGQVTATKNILVTQSDGTYDTNKWGDLIQLIAQTTHGALVEQPRFILPILYRRDRNAARAF
jgi:hypothetical protein